MVKAVIYIPTSIDGYGRFCREGTGYITRREYEYAGHVRDPDLIDYLLATEQATVVVLLNPAHRVDGKNWPTELIRPEQAAPPLTADVRRHNGRVSMSQMAGQDGGAPEVHTARNVRRIGDEGQTVRLPSARYVRSVIFGDAPAPSGMDPGMIAAARRIAKRLRPN